MWMFQDEVLTKEKATPGGLSGDFDDTFFLIFPHHRRRPMDWE